MGDRRRVAHPRSSVLETGQLQRPRPLLLDQSGSGARGERMVVMGRLSAVRGGIVLRAIVVSGACVAAGSMAGIGSAHPGGAATAAGCKPVGGEVVTLRLKVPGHVLRADVGDTIKVIAGVPGGRANAPQPFDHKHAVCRIFVRRVSKGEVIATFRARRAWNEKITFGASGVTSSKGCRPESHGCPHPVLVIGYVKVSSSARSASKARAPRFTG